MEITYQGGASFLVKGSRVIAINPREKADRGSIVLHSKRQSRTKNIVNGPGEYEIGGVLISSLPRGSRDSGALAHAVEIDGLTVLHLGEKVDELTQADLETIGRVDVLLINADDPRAGANAVKELLPRVVVPFGRAAAELCAELGVRDAAPQTRFSWNGTGTPPKAALLKAPAIRKRAA